MIQEHGEFLAKYYTLEIMAGDKIISTSDINLNTYIDFVDPTTVKLDL